MPPRTSVSSASHVRDATPADTSTVKTLSPPAGVVGFAIAVETTSARVTFDGSTPSATNGFVVVKDLQPEMYAFTPSAVKWVSTAAAISVVNVCWLF